jgi:DnaJ-class molecular chaperone
MAKVHTHYDNLKVARNAPPEVIRAAYKTLSQKYHPDRKGNSPNAIRVIQIINSAYTVLSDPEKRREHDEWIARNEAGDNQVEIPKFRENTAAHGKHRHSRRSHHKGFFGVYSARQLSPHVLRTMHKLRILLDHFSRKLFGKT